MELTHTDYPAEKAACYDLLARQLAALCEGVPCPLSNLSNCAALLFAALPELNWAGFYLAQGEALLLGPFQGKTACVRIPFGRGVCGTAAQTRALQLVADVHAFPGHIACDSASASEIVVPLVKDGVFLGVLDIDSPVLGRFDSRDAEGLQALCAILLNACDFSGGLLGTEARA